MPIDSDPRFEVDNIVGNLPNGFTLSVESQLKLRAFYEYVDKSRKILSEVYENLSFPESPAKMRKASALLGQLCIEADSWGFSSLYEVGLGLQMRLLNSGDRMQALSNREPLDRGLKMLSALLEQCETDFRWRLAIADTLEHLSKAV